MKWVKFDETVKIPIKSWCDNIEEGATVQAVNLANHPAIVKHVSLMPDCHQGYGMPIGGVIACKNAVIPNAVGVDIGCGMGAVQTDFHASNIEGKKHIRELLDYIKEYIPVGEGNHNKKEQNWDGFEKYLNSLGLKYPIDDFSQKNIPEWLTSDVWKLASMNLGTLGGGNHFIELQKNEEGFIWLMLHSGSRNMGLKIANHYNKIALLLNNKWHSNIPSTDLAFLPLDTLEGEQYIRDMRFALEYAQENRRRMMNIFKEAVLKHFKEVNFIQEINIHHNYASLENHFGQNLWIHRKGATSAKLNEMGIIPGSMGTASYIVKGKGNEDSFMSCSHGAGRKIGRNEACKTLNIKECNKFMEGIVFDRWNKYKPRGKKNSSGLWDLSEAPLAYKDIDYVIESELDLIEPLVKLKPLGVVKG